MRKQLKLMAATAAMTVMMASTAFAAGWQQNSTGWWYGTNDTNTEWYANGWQWIDGNQDGTAECYYFDVNGYMLAGTTTPDGFQVNEGGAWVENGAAQTQTQPIPTPNPQPFGEEQKVDEFGIEWRLDEFDQEWKVDRDYVKSAPGWEHDERGWKYKLEDGTYAVGDPVYGFFPYLIDGNEDGIYEIFEFDADGYMKESSWVDEHGRSCTYYWGYNKYHDRHKAGPYEFVKKGNVWYDAADISWRDNAGCAEITGDPYGDAVRATFWIDEVTTKIDCGVIGGDHTEIRYIN